MINVTQNFEDTEFEMFHEALRTLSPEQAAYQERCTEETRKREEWMARVDAALDEEIEEWEEGDEADNFLLN